MKAIEIKNKNKTIRKIVRIESPELYMIAFDDYGGIVTAPIRSFMTNVEISEISSHTNRAREIYKIAEERAILAGFKKDGDEWDYIAPHNDLCELAVNIVGQMGLK